MSQQSDGRKKNARKSERTRHFSLGTMSTEEINLVIGTSLNTKKEQITSKQPNQNMSGIPDSELDENTNIQDVTKVANSPAKSDNEVFKPKNAIKRTPIKEKQVAEIQLDVQSGKRNRTGSSPDFQVNKKRHFVENQEGELQHTCLNEDIILELFNNLDVIDNITNSSHLPHNDQNYLRQAHTNLHKLITRIVFQYNTLEKTNIILKNKIQSNDENAEQTTKTGYSDILKTVPQKATDNRTKNKDSTVSQNKDNLPWTTPPTIKRHETKIEMKNIEDPNRAIRQLKTELKNKDIGKGFKNIQQTKDGSIIVESFDKDQQKQLQMVLKDNKNIKLKELGEEKPMFMLTGIEKGFSEEEFLEELQNLDSEVTNDLGYSATKKIEIVAKKQCRNPCKENWILQAPPQVVKWFLKKGTVFFDLVRVYVQEYFNLAICFKCSGFGHISKYCSENERCHKCGGEHHAKDCKVEHFKCPNCIKVKSGSGDINHSARSKSCPVYLKKLTRFKANINYNDFL